MTAPTPAHPTTMISDTEPTRTAKSRTLSPVSRTFEKALLEHQNEAGEHQTQTERDRDADGNLDKQPFGPTRKTHTSYHACDSNPRVKLNKYKASIQISKSF